MKEKNRSYICCLLTRNFNLKKSLQTILLNISLFFAFLCPYFKLGGRLLNSAYVFIMLPALFYLFEQIYYYKHVQIRKSLLVPIICLGITFGLSLLNQCLFFTNDFTMIRLSFVGIFIYLAARFYYQEYSKLYNEHASEYLIKNFINTIYINSLISLLCIFIVPFRDIFYSYIGINELVYSYRIQTRFSGFIFTGFSFLSTTNAFAAIIILVFIFDNKENVFFGFFKLLIILIHIIFVGRTGIIIFALGIIFYLFFSINKKDRRQVKRFRILIITFIPIILLVVFFFLDLELIVSTLNWAFEFFLNFAKSGEFSSSSTDELLAHHIIFPATSLNLLFGNGLFSRDYVPSDIGYIQVLMGGGLIILFTCFSLYLISMISFFISNKTIYSFCLFFISISLLIVNFKDLYYISYTVYTLLFFVLYSIVYGGGSDESNSCTCNL